DDRHHDVCLTVSLRFRPPNLLAVTPRVRHISGDLARGLPRPRGCPWPGLHTPLPTLHRRSRERRCEVDRCSFIVADSYRAPRRSDGAQAIDSAETAPAVAAPRALLRMPAGPQPGPPAGVRGG